MMIRRLLLTHGDREVQQEVLESLLFLKTFVKKIRTIAKHHITMKTPNPSLNPETPL
jgi:hypothetical protein